MTSIQHDFPMLTKKECLLLQGMLRNQIVILESALKENPGRKDATERMVAEYTALITKLPEC